MKKFLTIKDGHEEGVNELIPIEEGMETGLLRCIDHLLDGKMEIELSFGTMSDEEFRENEIKSIMNGECCSKEEAIKIIEDA